MWWRARRLAAVIGKWHWPSALQMLIARCAGVSKAEVALAHPLAVIMQRMPSTKTVSTPPRRRAKDARFSAGSRHEAERSLFAATMDQIGPRSTSTRRSAKSGSSSIDQRSLSELL
jgi:hypothetical protein